MFIAEAVAPSTKLLRIALALSTALYLSKEVVLPDRVTFAVDIKSFIPF